MLIAVRKRNAEYDEMCDLKTLKQWARTGEIHPEDLVKESGEWKPAKQAAVLKGFFATAAWDVSEEVLWKPQLTKHQQPVENDVSTVAESEFSAPSSDLSSPKTQSIEAKLTATSRIQEVDSGASTDAVQANSVNTIDYDEVEREYLRSKPQHDVDRSSDSTPSVSTTLPLTDSESQSVQTPYVEGRINDAPVRWNPDMDIKDQLGILVDEVPPKSNFSWFRLMILVVPGAFILFFIRAFVISEAQTVFPESGNPEIVDTEALREGNAPVPTNTQSDALYELESTLKSKLRQNTQLVTPEQSLSDALRVDLEYVGLDIVRIDARVLKWKGRLLNQPKSASITIVVSSNGEVETEFILASLVVAKYSVRYYLEMPRFTIVIQDGDVALSKTISTEKAQFLYLQPGSLKDFIRALSD